MFWNFGLHNFQIKCRKWFPKNLRCNLYLFRVKMLSFRFSSFQSTCFLRCNAHQFLVAVTIRPLYHSGMSSNYRHKWIVTIWLLPTSVSEIDIWQNITSLQCTGPPHFGIIHFIFRTVFSTFKLNQWHMLKRFRLESPIFTGIHRYCNTYNILRRLRFCTLCVINISALPDSNSAVEVWLSYSVGNELPGSSSLKSVVKSHSLLLSFQGPTSYGIRLNSRSFLEFKRRVTRIKCLEGNHAPQYLSHCCMYNKKKWYINLFH